MNQKNVSMLILESDNTKITNFDLTFKSLVFHYRVVKTVGEFIELLQLRQWDYIFLEHDLFKVGGFQNSSDPESGFYALKYLLENYNFNEFIKRIIIHTNNVVGARNMLDMAYVSGFNNITHLVFGSSEFKAEVTNIRKEIELV